ncbi:Sucrose transport protein SUC3, partial [Cucurbita argyrosperma subsp. sororia]
MAGKPSSVSFRVPYRNLQDAEVEMVAVDEQQLQGIDLNSPSSSRCANGSPDGSSSTPHVRSTPNSLIILILSCTIAAGVQFGWALQLSLLTPYIQTLGIEHAFSSFIWLCGPITGLVVGPDQHNVANAVFCSWMAVGNILGFSAGASGNWHKWFPFLLSLFANHMYSYSAPLLNGNEQSSPSTVKSELNSPNGSNDNYGYQKDVNLEISKSIIEENHSESYYDGPATVVVKLLTSLRHLPPAMHSVLLVMALSWLSWFPFFLFDTDWMGREVYHGDPKGSLADEQVYDQGVRAGAFGLLLNSVVLGISSFFIEPMCQRMGARLVWAISNFIVFACMTGTTIISLISVSQYSEGIEHVIGGNSTIKNAALAVFVLLGFPLAITYSVPFSLTAELTADSGGGQGLAIGVLNLAVVIPQMIVSLGAGPWDALFSGGNIPAFALASVCALAAGVVALLRLPDHTNSSFKSTGFHFG